MSNLMVYRNGEHWVFRDVQTMEYIVLENAKPKRLFSRVKGSFNITDKGLDDSKDLCDKLASGEI